MVTPDAADGPEGSDGCANKVRKLGAQGGLEIFWGKFPGFEIGKLSFGSFFHFLALFCVGIR